MKHKILTLLFLGMFLISFTSAITIYSGESYSFESEEFEYYTVTGNSSNMDGMNISWDGNTTISFSKYFAPDTFTLIFFNSEKEIIIEHHHSSSGGGTRKIYVENKTTTEVDNYIDRIIYNDTEIDILNDKINKLEKDLKNKEELNNISRILMAVLLVLLIITIFYIIKKDEN